MTEIERKKKYRLHRLRLQKATPIVDSQAPRITRVTKEKRELTFLDMMKAMYKNKSPRTFTKSPIRMKRTASTSIMMNANMKMNMSCSERRESSQTNIGCRRSTRCTNKPMDMIPGHIVQRYQELPFICTPQVLYQLLRPRVYLDLHTSYGQPLGRLVIQLFTEACPEVVLQFVSVCMQGHPAKFNLTRLFASMWLEGELQVDDKSALTDSNIEHDPSAINHGSSAGILSFPSRYLRGSKYRFISFTISFKPLEVLNGKRIAFGRVIRGLNVLNNLQNFQVSHTGKLVRKIIVSACGVN